ncbi:uncharacterized protein LOC143178535 [Calliopsis andreniformis]|uniref:uncharacterized protein LOC143178535 n=1 Tax=Calliopsis andreniformis TaxID=337506 RepID=UPI003FCE0FD1
MPLRSEASSSRDTLNTVMTTDEQSRTGRYVAGGAVLAITLLGVHHILLQDASTIAGVCIPAIIMVSYIIWILYSAHRDRRKASRLATAMQLAEVISVPASSDDATFKHTNPRKNRPTLAYDSRDSCTLSPPKDFIIQYILFCMHDVFANNRHSLRPKVDIPTALTRAVYARKIICLVGAGLFIYSALTQPCGSTVRLRSTCPFTGN